MALVGPLPPLYAITNLELSNAGTHDVLVGRLLDSGVRLVQVRDKRTPDRDLLEQVDASVRLARDAGAILIVNDRVDIALASRAAGAHLGEEDLSADDARRILGDEAVIGVSTHSGEAAVEAADLPVDYVAVGPVFESSTKRTRRKVLGPGTIAWIRARTPVPIVAIGGITLDRVREVREAGASSVAVIAGLYRGGDPGARIARFLQVAAAGSPPGPV